MLHPKVTSPNTDEVYAEKYYVGRPRQKPTPIAIHRQQQQATWTVKWLVSFLVPEF